MPATIAPPEIPILKQRFPGEVLLRFRRNPLTVLEEMAEMADVSKLRLLNFRFFMINDPALIKEILVTKSDAFIKGRPVQFLGYLLGQGLLNSEHAFQQALAQQVTEKLYRLSTTTGLKPMQKPWRDVPIA